MIYFGDLAKQLNSKQGRVAFGLNFPNIPENYFKPDQNNSFELNKVLNSFPNNLDLTIGQVIDQEVISEAEKQMMRIGEFDFKLKGIVFDEIIRQLKATRIRESSLFEYLVVEIMKQIDSFNMQRFYRGTICLAEKSANFPKNFPFLLRQGAEAVVKGKLKDAIDPQEVLQYLVEKERKKARNLIERDLEFARKQGVDEVGFASLMFELNRLFEAPPTKEEDFRNAIIRGMKGEEVNIVHIKCLRFVYPKEGGIKILTDIEDLQIGGIRGKYQPKSEKPLFPRLLNFKTLLEERGIRTCLTVLVADEDIDLLYPLGNPYITEEQKKKAKKDAQIYLEFLRGKYFQETILFLSEYVVQNSLERVYQKRRSVVLEDLRTGRGKIVNPSFFEINRIGHQYEYYQKLLGSVYTRDEARRSSMEQITSVVALETVFSSFSQPVIVVEENRGGENNLIGGGKFPTVFIKLRDEAILF
ncbi:hypothetical protein COT64_00910 [Candidatus Shapirobacteria bacterium CG09_land_8_20_14_0_10_39_12]|uniref:Uncharacterized protein n=1 Tax=Candidatus Shapirobacteria bacterium CG09_land_8_20_14_0_10_39_12 TaxID=1974885 RepID=A0A2H0WS88_9BACT|nr:MAG: hypothetical protein COT64_00910 [Candidatus Shapirobacteria bacterium CG09_land_8_20_14_0_10_39_12]